LSDDPDRSVGPVDAGENPTARSLCNSLTVDEKHAYGGESIRDDASI